MWMQMAVCVYVAERCLRFAPWQLGPAAADPCDPELRNKYGEWMDGTKFYMHWACTELEQEKVVGEKWPPGMN